MKFFTKSVEVAQRKVENNNYFVRRQVVEYDNVLNKQREEVYRERNKILNKEDMHDKILEMITENVEHVCNEYLQYNKVDEADVEGFNKALEARMIEPGTELITYEFLKHNSKEEVVQIVLDLTLEKYKAKEQRLSEIGFNLHDLERVTLLQTLDKKWIDHIDAMDVLRQGIGLRTLGNQSPIVGYQNEGFDMFEDMIQSMRLEVADKVLGIRINEGNTITQAKAKVVHSNAEHKAQGSVKKNDEVGRNSPCPCGSGKKYKNCCGKNVK